MIRFQSAITPNSHIIVTIFFFFNDTATTEIYTLSLHDALPITPPASAILSLPPRKTSAMIALDISRDRKSTRLNSSHQINSYAVFCLKKKKKTYRMHHIILIQQHLN